MTNIATFLTTDHRDCDNTFVDFENQLPTRDWPVLDRLWQDFSTHLLDHLSMEEQVLFPAFEQATGIVNGPTSVMRLEHEQMRELLSDMNQALSDQDDNKAQGIAETLMFMMQQHNMKEENMLYPMCDGNIDSAATIEKMKAQSNIHQQCA